jgi:hypothetical protein
VLVGRLLQQVVLGCCCCSLQADQRDPLHAVQKLLLMGQLMHCLVDGHRPAVLLLLLVVWVSPRCWTWRACLCATAAVAGALLGLLLPLPLLLPACMGGPGSC